jgi:hypothetical protein
MEIIGTGRRNMEFRFSLRRTEISVRLEDRKRTRNLGIYDQKQRQ